MTTVQEIAGIFSLSVEDAETLVTRGIFREEGSAEPISQGVVDRLARGTFKVQEVAKYCRVDERAVHRWIGAGKLDHIRVGTRYRVRCATIITLLGPWFGDRMLRPSEVATMLGCRADTLRRRKDLTRVRMPSGVWRYPSSAEEFKK